MSNAMRKVCDAALVWADLRKTQYPGEETAEYLEAAVNLYQAVEELRSGKVQDDGRQLQLPGFSKEGKQ